MNVRYLLRFSSVLVPVMVAATTAPAAAQSGAGLLIKPWAEGARAELHGDALVQGESETDDRLDDSFELRWYEGNGRYRINTGRGAPTIGFDFQHIDLRSSHPALPDNLVDQSIGVGFGLGEFGLGRFGDWQVGLTLGGGYAGDNPYGAGDAYYALADLILSTRLDPDSTLQIIINYNGNRSIRPDLPLPGVAYSHRQSDTLRYTLGVPYSSITWEPFRGTMLEATYSIPYTLNATASWRVGATDVALFGSFQNRFNAYHLERLSEHRRLFFQQRRIEGGVKWTPGERADLSAAVGYAFDQEFERGYDTFDTESVVDVDAAPYVRLAFNLSF